MQWQQNQEYDFSKVASAAEIVSHNVNPLVNAYFEQIAHLIPILFVFLLSSSGDPRPGPSTWPPSRPEDAVLRDHSSAFLHRTVSPNKKTPSDTYPPSVSLSVDVSWTVRSKMSVAGFKKQFYKASQVWGNFPSQLSDSVSPLTASHSC